MNETFEVQFSVYQLSGCELPLLLWYSRKLVFKCVMLLWPPLLPCP